MKLTRYFRFFFFLFSRRRTWGTYSITLRVSWDETMINSILITKLQFTRIELRKLSVSWFKDTHESRCAMCVSVLTAIPRDQQIIINQSNSHNIMAIEHCCCCCCYCCFFLYQNWVIQMSVTALRSVQLHKIIGTLFISLAHMVRIDCKQTFKWLVACISCK